MEKAMKQYSCWRKENLPQDLQEELAAIENRPEEIFDRFCGEIRFGTSGLRGRMGAGTSRINSVVLRRATMALADILLEKHEKPAIALSYDTRLHSRGYAQDVAETLASRGIDTWMTEAPEPVPLLSFTIRQMGLDGGIMITASHNPREYNGYKVYDHCGSQIDDEKARQVEARMDLHDYFEAGPKIGFTEVGWRPQAERGEGAGAVRYVPTEVIEAYRAAIRQHAVWWTTEEKVRRQAMARLTVAYTPLNGTGLSHGIEIFRHLGIEDVRLVNGQTAPDGNFTTCPSPNPENRKTFEQALAQYGESGVDLILATDPDSDRMGALVFQKGRYIKLSGNEAGVLMLDYLCAQLSRQTVLQGKKVYKSLVTTPLTEPIAAQYGLIVENTLTGFKHIAAKIEALCRDGREDEFVFGFEESSGYLYGVYTRDKDGIMAMQLMCLAAAFWKTQGMTLIDRLNQIRETYGYVETLTDAVIFEKEKDRTRISDLMASLFAGGLPEILGRPVTVDATHQAEKVFQGEITGEDGYRHRFVIRPSGTELKIKAYVFAQGDSRYSAVETAEAMLKAIMQFLRQTQNLAS